MKRLHIGILIALILILVALLSACATSRSSEEWLDNGTGSSYYSASRSPRTFSVTGTAQINVVPDEAVLTLGVQTLDKDLKTARQQNDERIERILAGADEIGVEPKNVQTDFMSITPQYTTRVTIDPEALYKHDEQVFEGFSVSKNVVITLKDLSRLEDLLTFVMDEGANYLQGIEFKTTQMQELRAQARESAVKAAKEKASAMAVGLSATLGPVQTMNENQGGYWPSGISSLSSSYLPTWGGSVANTVQNAGGEYYPLEGTVAPGQIAITSQVSVVFALE